MKDGPSSCVCIPCSQEGLTYVAVLASVARGAQAHDVSLCLLAGPSATGLLGTGPGRGCNPQGEAEHPESTVASPELMRVSMFW